MAVVVDDALRLVGRGNGGDGGLVAVADEDDGDSDELAAKKGACDDVSVAYGAECTGRLGRCVSGVEGIKAGGDEGAVATDGLEGADASQSK